MAKYRKRPVVIDAVQFTGENLPEIADFSGYVIEGAIDGRHDQLVIETLEGNMTATPGCWIIKGIAGEMYPCAADIFSQTYEPVDEDV